MKIAYLTLDEVHEDLLRKLAETRGAEFCALPVLNPLPAGGFDAVIYDLDYLPPEQRQAVLAELLSGHVSHRAAVHGYNLRKSQVQGLRRRGVIVSRTPERALSRVLRDSAVATPSPASRPVGRPVTPHGA
jgi:hypothetical protein